MALAKKPGPFMVLAGAGMCTGGRILSHLQNHLGDPSTLVLMVGYQSRGSLGRKLADRETSVRIAGRLVHVRGRTHLFGGLSGHAGQSDLLNWFGSLALVASARHPHARRGRPAQHASRAHPGAIRPAVRDAGLSRDDRDLTRRLPEEVLRREGREGDSVHVDHELWEVVNELTRLRPSKRERYRVAIFGSRARRARHLSTRRSSVSPPRLQAWGVTSLLAVARA